MLADDREMKPSPINFKRPYGVLRVVRPSEVELIAVSDNGKLLGYMPKSDFMVGGMYLAELPESQKNRQVTPFGTIWYQLDMAGLKPDRAEKLGKILRGLQDRGIAGNHLPAIGNA